MRDKVLKAVAVLSSARGAAADEEKHLQTCEETRAATLEARDILQQISTSIQQDVHSRLAKVVSRCLEAVFEEPYDFQIRFESKRGKTEANLEFVRGDLTCDPLSSCGGGVIDVAAFALRLACLCLSRPPLRRILILDEPFRFLSRAYRGKIRQLITTLAAEMSVQMIIVTHIAELECGTVIELQ